jgi:hypothetical protein
MLADDAFHLALLASWTSFVVRYLKNHNLSAAEFALPSSREGYELSCALCKELITELGLVIEVWSF